LGYNPPVPDRQLHVQELGGFWPPTWPMGLTMLRLLLLPVFLWVLLLDARDEGHRHRWIAVGIFAVMAITDKLDGYLARRLKQTTRIGTILDPVADKLLVACSVILLGFDWMTLEGFAIPWPVIVAIYGKDLIVAMGTLVLLSLIGSVKITPRPLGKLSTVLQLAMVMTTLLAVDLVRWNPEFAHRLARGLWWGVSIVAILACIDYVLQGVKQFKAGRAYEK
jgi:CDP-diacylglycerol--glycerol-3-phosphate 3-phosphatidyltransferase